MANILLIGPVFFGYTKSITNCMEADGHTVKLISDRPSESFLNKVIVRLSPSLVRSSCYNYFKRELDSLGDFEPNLVLVVKGEGLNKKIMSYMKTAYRHAKFVNYQWDAVSNVPSFHDIYHMFDFVYTFDRSDAERYQLIFHPLFFVGNGSASHHAIVERKFHLSFIGTIHSDRYSVINKIKNNMGSDIDCFWYPYVTDRAVFFIRKFFDYRYFSSKLSEFRFTPLPKNEAYDVFMKSTCILDIERPQQRGLTMRTIEVLSLGRKLITTNFDIVNYDLYDSGNVLIIDRNNPVIPRTFLIEPPKSIDLNVLERYTLSSWLNDVVYTHL